MYISKFSYFGGSDMVTMYIMTNCAFVSLLIFLQLFSFFLSLFFFYLAGESDVIVLVLDLRRSPEQSDRRVGDITGSQLRDA